MCTRCFIIKLFVFTLCLTKIGANLPSQRIIGGNVANAGQFPYAAAIYVSTVSGNYFCGGVIIVTSEWILTAGQCVDGALLFTILLGTNSLEGNDSTAVRVATETYVLHPDYNPETLHSDLALIKLREPVTFTVYLNSINLPSENLKEGETGRAYGWGQTNDQEAGLNNQLNWVDLEVLSSAECKMVYGNQITDSMMCLAGNYNEGTCVGDSGSALIQLAGRGWTIVVGLSSFISSNGCESTDPSGYTKIFGYNEWIRNITGK